MIDRRSLLLSLFAAPAIVRASSLMKVKPWIEELELAVPNPETAMLPSGLIRGERYVIRDVTDEFTYSVGVWRPRAQSKDDPVKIGVHGPSFKVGDVVTFR